ncbi:MAG: hypothetical protein JWQ96_1597 [Segetibacter sp.]|nr:hypothetical protein [Segetibacter sp.]
MKLHEIEIFSSTPEKAKEFYGEALGLRLHVDRPGLKVYDPGIEGVDLNISEHYPENKISISFLVRDLDAYLEMLRAKGKQVNEPYSSHLGMRSITLIDYEGYRIVINGTTESSPEWLKELAEQEA